MNAMVRHRIFLALGFTMLTLAGGMIVMGLMTRPASTTTVGTAEPDPAFGSPLEQPAPAFSLINADGEAFDSETLAGQVWVVDFIFTRCQLVCPIMTLRMSQLQERLELLGLKDARMVSISVDPDNDTPEVLAAFADKYSADRARWSFLTGDRTTIWDLVQDGFKLALDEDPGNDMMPITHSSRILVVDRSGTVRATFDGLTEGTVEAIAAYVGALSAE